jgi:hypothetical protein
MAALIGPDLEKPRFRNPVEPGPVEPVVGEVDLAGERGHERDVSVSPSVKAAMVLASVG